MRILFNMADTPICLCATGGLMSKVHTTRYGDTRRASPPPQLYAILRHDQLWKTEMDISYGMLFGRGMRCMLWQSALALVSWEEARVTLSLGPKSINDHLINHGRYELVDVIYVYESLTVFDFI